MTLWLCSTAKPPGDPTQRSKIWRSMVAYALIGSIRVELSMNVSLHQASLPSILFAQQNNFQVHLPCHFIALNASKATPRYPSYPVELRFHLPTSVYCHCSRDMHVTQEDRKASWRCRTVCIEVSSLYCATLDTPGKSHSNTPGLNYLCALNLFLASSTVARNVLF